VTRHPYVAIEGVIGVGKTTLVRLLSQDLGATQLLEVFEENPFLSDFYSDRARYAFQTQIFSCSAFASNIKPSLKRWRTGHCFPITPSPRTACSLT
jgi:deoxyadenosine/deoxycytidine kinase